ncbi:hypothetical protein BDP27DRAFT_1446754 [Rhodocollybia butyracea]|uniref:RING-type domain-containing protein n=1 Tax=Rhodocollybia butyracea TaxID=206335 RepID=A0A9P5UAB7_9AGAR|nr:hypothetical protein BDP27DRAFT_1446754 [Rhodocollybia butyracea]
MRSSRPTRTNSIIEVSGPSNSKRSTRSKAASRPIAPLVVHPDVIEISDSDDDPPATLKRKNSAELQLEHDVKRLKKENEAIKTKEKNLMAEIARQQDELAMLRAISKPDPSKIYLAISDVEDSVVCEVCTMKMWTPYILECGHTYCQSCLKARKFYSLSSSEAYSFSSQDWFSTTLALHNAAHPNYNINQPQPHQMPYGMDAYGHHYMHLLAATVPEPQYTCPTCREQVRNPPVEDFNLKKVVRIVADAQGEASPRKETTRKKVKGKAPAVRENPWSGFFRKKI